MFIFVDVPLTLFYICIRMFYFFNLINHKKDNAQEKLDFKYCNFWRRFVSNKVMLVLVYLTFKAVLFSANIF